jgi:hypothetical protein
MDQFTIDSDVEIEPEVISNDEREADSNNSDAEEVNASFEFEDEQRISRKKLTKKPKVSKDLKNVADAEDSIRIMVC